MSRRQKDPLRPLSDAEWRALARLSRSQSGRRGEHAKVVEGARHGRISSKRTARKRSDTVGEIGSLAEGHSVGWLSCPEVAHVALPAAAGPTRAGRPRPHRPGRIPTG